ncbi:unnamed protein product [Oppiella nova]|uniref:Uncharacterized protein n=1 Tax=Oppiella nova TaxID=334625 RepID=A0A7R9QMK8_9ACAR|nr:unnamed protein product [Oppiella nova]CAG2168850.1 unnamed protein product [Oppiella nova]
MDTTIDTSATIDDNTEGSDALEELNDNSENTKNISKPKEIKIALKRLFKNPILIFHALAGIFRVFGYFGYYIFKPKYMEMQYRQSASGASFFTGSTSVVTMAIGIMGGGVIIKYFKPKPRPLVIFMFCVELVASFAIFSAMFLGCPAPVFPNSALLDGKISLANSCNFGCDCSTRVYQPICSSDGKTGNCWLYDVDKFRVYLHGAAFGFMILGSVFDIGIIVLSNRLKNLLDDDNEEDDKKNEIKLLEKSTNSSSSHPNGKSLSIEES